MQSHSGRTHVVEFLKRHVIGAATVAAPVVTRIERDEITSIYEEDTIFSNWTESMTGFAFNMTTLARGTRYLSGKELKAEGTLNAVRILRYEITERVSTRALIGFSRFISSTNTEPDPFAGALFLVQMSMKDGSLEVEENQVGYSDRITADGTAKPVAVDGVYSFSMRNGRLEIQYRQKTFEVDPVTLRRTKTDETFPTQLSHAISFPQPLTTIP